MIHLRLFIKAGHYKVINCFVDYQVGKVRNLFNLPFSIKYITISEQWYELDRYFDTLPFP